MGKITRPMMGMLRTIAAKGGVRVHLIERATNGTVQALLRRGLITMASGEVSGKVYSLTDAGRASAQGGGR